MVDLRAANSITLVALQEISQEEFRHANFTIHLHVEIYRLHAFTFLHFSDLSLTQNR